MSEMPTNPGSLNKFAELYPNQSQQNIKDIYYNALDDYRRDQANYFGITLEQLHDGELLMPQSTESN